MEERLEDLAGLVDAEDFLAFFGIPYDPRVVNVNRLHILKKFGLLREAVERESGGLPPEVRLARLKEAMQQAYETFVTSSAAEQRLFKVFQQPPPGVGFVPVGEIRHRRAGGARMEEERDERTGSEGDRPGPCR